MANFISVGLDGRTPAMRLGLAKQPLTYKDILWPGESATGAARPPEGQAAQRAAASLNEPMRSTAPYPPGHLRRARLRELLQDLGATRVGVTFETRGGQYLLLSYRTEPVRHRLAGAAHAGTEGHRQGPDLPRATASAEPRRQARDVLVGLGAGSRRGRVLTTASDAREAR